MAKQIEQNENINSLCKKYFTPELCEELVTESKTTLQNKICKQLILYGRKIWNSKGYRNLENLDKGTDIFYENEDFEVPLVMDESIYEAIATCFNAWKKEPPTVAYTVYFATTVSNSFSHNIDKELNEFGGTGVIIQKIRDVKKIAKNLGISCDTKEDFIKVAKSLFSEEEVNELVDYEYKGNKYTIKDSGPIGDDDEDEESPRFLSDLRLFDDFLQDGSDTENQTIVNEQLTVLFSVMEDIFKSEKEDDGFLSRVLTFKILTHINVYRYSEDFLRSLNFIDNDLLTQYYNNQLPKQDSLERSKGSVNKKWNQFCDKMDKDERIKHFQADSR